MSERSVTIPESEYLYLLKSSELVSKLETELAEVRKELDSIQKKIKSFEVKKDSSNSGIPPSKDENRFRKRTESLRESSGKKSGGQHGHKGTTLQMSSAPDKVIDLKPKFCPSCRTDISTLAMQLKECRQKVVLPVVQPTIEEYRSYSCVCNCGEKVQMGFDQGITPGISYDSNCEALIAYLHSRQYLSFNRIAEFFNHIFNLPISEGTVQNMLLRFSNRIKGTYHKIKDELWKQNNVGCDETGIHVNTEKYWLWTWQNEKFTFLHPSNNRGSATIIDQFPNGFENSILVHDCLPAQFKVEAKDHQICIPHLLRELKYLWSKYRNSWSEDCKQLLKDVIGIESQLVPQDYLQPPKKVLEIENKIDKLLTKSVPVKHEQLMKLKNRLLKYRHYITTCLYHIDVPSDNNGSERALRNAKVKQKISGHFKTLNGLEIYAIIRSVIDTLIKQKLNIFEHMTLSAKIYPE